MRLGFSDITFNNRVGLRYSPGELGNRLVCGTSKKQLSCLVADSKIVQEVLRKKSVQNQEVPSRLGVESNEGSLL
jgi:hypothetical protein